jgi:NAD(P)H-dependent flavin oxidoreductase YrpB (nitropropane dioxygenase family)
MNSALCRLLGIEHPIVLAPMAGAVGAEFAAVVSNAGGLGVLPLWQVDVATLRSVVRRTMSLTDRPFAVNLNLDFSQEDHLAACLEEGVRIISFFWQDPGPLIQVAKDGGAIVMHTIGNAVDAKRAVNSGVDIIVAQGWEAGGHVRGTVATLPLVPTVVDAVGDVPVVAAGGIADGRGLAAVMALGASGGWIGTRFLASIEAEIHPEYQAKVLLASENDTVYLESLFDVGWPAAPHRVLRNSTVDRWENAGRPESGARPGEGDIVASSTLGGDIVRYGCYSPKLDTVGDIEALSMWAGQGLSMVTSVKSAAEIVREIMQEAEKVIHRLVE